MRLILRTSYLSFIILFVFVVDSSSSLSQINTHYLKLISPNGGEKWEVNSTQNITWESDQIARIKIEVSLSGGIDWHVIVSSIDASTGKYSWHIPDIIIDRVLIRISDISNPSLYDISDKTFSIVKKIVSAKNKTEQNVIKSNDPPIKIMPLGDSITQGAGDDPNQIGYRSRLFDLLQSAGYNFDFVGTQHSGNSYTGNPAFDADHEGHSGMEVGSPSVLSSTMLNSIDYYLTQHTPDIVLFHMGTNDLDHGDNPLLIAKQLDSVITDHILVHNPNTMTFWAKIIHNEHVSEATLNYDIGTIYDSFTPQEKSRTKLVYMQSPPHLIYPDDFSTPTSGNEFIDLHPIKSGYDKMAEHWFAAMQDFYQPKPASPLSNSINQPVNVSLNWNAPPAASNFSVFYELQVATDSDFSNIVYDTSNISTTSVEPSGLQYGTKYFWRTRIKNYGWSDTLSFTTMPFSVHIKVFLQGPYAGDDTMHTYLRSMSDFPREQPYYAAPWNYSGSESVISIPPKVVDWVLVELKQTYNGPAVSERAAFLRNDGIIFDTSNVSADYVNFYGISPGDYYIVVKHRNHLPVMSANAVSLPGNSTYDFTSDSNHVFFKKSVINLGNGKYGMVSGDNDHDGVISINDYNFIAESINKSGYNIPDDDMNGVVSKSDYNLVSRNLFRYSGVH